jgi:hypothetical protein
MGIVLYWLEREGDDWVPCCEAFADGELPQALKGAEVRRKAGCPHVSISTELADHIGKAGVDAVEDGRTPDGHAYEWSKAGRAGKVRRG